MLEKFAKDLANCCLCNWEANVESFLSGLTPTFSLRISEYFDCHD